MTDEAALRHLIDRQAIIDCLNRYTRGVDRHDDDLIASAYHSDAVDDHGSYIGPVAGLIDHVNRSHDESFDSHQHHMTNHVVEIVGDEAHAESYMLCFFRRRASETVEAVGGRYVDRLERRRGEWRITDRVVVVEWRGLLDGDPPAAARMLFIDGRQDRDDVSYERPLRVQREHRSS